MSQSGHSRLHFHPIFDLLAHPKTLMSTPGIFRRVWYRWKALRLPWRKQFLVGHDLAGNTFWEFKDAINAGRLRRIVRYGHEAHYADVKISRK